MAENEIPFQEQWIQCLDSETQKILENEKTMQEFFDYLIRERSNHTVCNKIMIRAYCPDATDVRPKEAWEAVGVTVTKPDQAIWTLRYWGRIWGWQPQLEYDISATSVAGSTLPSQRIPSDYLIQLLICDTLVKLEFASEMSSLKAYYNSETRVITYTGGYNSYDEVCSRFCREYVHSLMHPDDYRMRMLEWDRSGLEGAPPYRYNRAEYDSVATMAVYMLEERFGLRKSKIRFYSNFNSLREARDYFQTALSAANRLTFHLQDVDRRLQKEDAERAKAKKEGGE